MSAFLTGEQWSAFCDKTVKKNTFIYIYKKKLHDKITRTTTISLDKHSRLCKCWIDVPELFFFLSHSPPLLPTPPTAPVCCWDDDRGYLQLQLHRLHVPQSGGWRDEQRASSCQGRALTRFLPDTSDRQDVAKVKINFVANIRVMQGSCLVTHWPFSLSESFHIFQPTFNVKLSPCNYFHNENILSVISCLQRPNLLELVWMCLETVSTIIPLLTTFQPVCTLTSVPCL